MFHAYLENYLLFHYNITGSSNESSPFNLTGQIFGYFKLLMADFHYKVSDKDDYHF